MHSRPWTRGLTLGEVIVPTAAAAFSIAVAVRPARGRPRWRCRRHAWLGLGLGSLQRLDKDLMRELNRIAREQAAPNLMVVPLFGANGGK